MSLLTALLSKVVFFARRYGRAGAWLTVFILVLRASHMLSYTVGVLTITLLFMLPTIIVLKFIDLASDFHGFRAVELRKPHDDSYERAQYRSFPAIEPLANIERSDISRRLASPDDPAEWANLRELLSHDKQDRRER